MNSITSRVCEISVIVLFPALVNSLRVIINGSNGPDCQLRLPLSNLVCQSQYFDVLLLQECIFYLVFFAIQHLVRAISYFLAQSRIQNIDYVIFITTCRMIEYRLMCVKDYGFSSYFWLHLTSNRMNTYCLVSELLTIGLCIQSPAVLALKLYGINFSLYPIRSLTAMNALHRYQALLEALNEVHQLGMLYPEPVIDIQDYSRIKTLVISEDNIQLYSECLICQENFNMREKIAIHQCSESAEKSFHIACISQWLNIKRQCPNCLTILTTVPNNNIQ